MHYKNIFDLLVSIKDYHHDNNMPVQKDELEDFLKYIDEIDDLGEEYKKILNEYLAVNDHDKIPDIMNLYMEYNAIVNCKKVLVSKEVTNSAVLHIKDKNILIEETFISVDILTEKFSFSVIELSETDLCEQQNNRFMTYSDCKKSHIRNSVREEIIESIQNDKVNSTIISMFMSEFTKDEANIYVNENPLIIGDTQLYFGVSYVASNEKFIILSLEDYAKHKLNS